MLCFCNVYTIVKSRNRNTTLSNYYFKELPTQNKSSFNISFYLYVLLMQEQKALHKGIFNVSQPNLMQRENTVDATKIKNRK